MTGVNDRRADVCGLELPEINDGVEVIKRDSPLPGRLDVDLTSTIREYFGSQQGWM